MEVVRNIRIVVVNSLFYKGLQEIENLKKVWINHILSSSFENKDKNTRKPVRSRYFMRQKCVEKYFDVNIWKNAGILRLLKSLVRKKFLGKITNKKEWMSIKMCLKFCQLEVVNEIIAYYM